MKLIMQLQHLLNVVEVLETELNYMILECNGHQKALFLKW